MSYCRWSCDNWKSDIYAYQSVDGWMTHVAGCRYVGADGSECPVVDWRVPKAEISKEYAACEKWLEDAKRVPIGRQFDGQTFIDGTLEDFRARLMTLRDAGYNFPDYVFTAIDEEIAGEANVA